LRRAFKNRRGNRKQSIIEIWISDRVLMPYRNVWGVLYRWEWGTIKSLKGSIRFRFL
jgi:hypothetical protein